MKFELGIYKGLTGWKDSQHFTYKKLSTMDTTFFQLRNNGELIKPNFDTAQDAYHYAIKNNLHRTETMISEWYYDEDGNEEKLGECTLDEAMEFKYETLDF